MSERNHLAIPSPEPGNVERWGWYSMGVNVILGGINLVVALASGSLAVRAEMVHNGVDFLTAVGVLIGLKLSTRKTSEFPYGLYKLENVITVGLALMIFVTAYEIARDALFTPPTRAVVDPWMLGGVILATVIPLVFSHYELRIGQRVNSPALIADAKEYRAHVLTTSVVFAALLGQWFEVPLDRFAALIIVVAIGKTGWELLSDGMRVLLDASLEPDTLLEIREIILDEPAVVDLDWVTGRNAGRFRFVEAQVTLRVDDLEKAESVTRRIEQKAHEAVPHVERVLIHAEPMQRTHLRYAAPLADAEGELSPHFGEAPAFALVTMRLEHGTVEERRILDNPFLEEERAKGIKVAEWLVDESVDVVFIKESLRGKGPVYVFRDAVAKIRETKAETLEEALEEAKEEDVR